MKRCKAFLLTVAALTVLLALVGCTQPGGATMPGPVTVEGGNATQTISVTASAPGVVATIAMLETPASVATVTGTAGLNSTELISRATDGTPGNFYSLNPAISADGRWVVWESLASNLVPNDTNACWTRFFGEVTNGRCTDIFVRDRQQGLTFQVSVSSDGTPANGESFNPTISANGEWVAFYSRATNLAPQYEALCAQRAWPNNCFGIFLHHQPTRQTELIVVLSNNGGIGPASGLSLSADGQRVAFNAVEPQLGGTPNDQGNVFVWDRQSGATVRVSVDGAGQPGDGSSYAPHLSADGRWVAFESLASNLVPDDTNGATDIFVYDTQTGQTERVSVASDGAQGNHESVRPFLSADGRFVTFSSRADTLVPGDIHQCDTVREGQQNCFDGFVHDRQTRQTERVSVASDGTEANDESSAYGISADGRWVVFESLATNLAPDDAEGTTIFFRDLQTGQTESLINEGGFAPAISADGQWLAFGAVTPLVPEDTQLCASLNGPGETNCWDIYVRSLGKVGE